MRRRTRALYRNRRRFAVHAILLFCAGYITFVGDPNDQNIWWLPLLAGAAYAAIIGPFLAIIALVIPAWRLATDVGAFGVVFIMAGTRLGWTVDFGSWTGLAICLVTFYGLGFLYTKPWLDPFLPKGPQKRVIRAASLLPADQLFDGLIGRPEAADRYAWFAIQPDYCGTLTQDPDNPRRTHLHAQVTDKVSTHETMTTTFEDYPYTRRYDWTFDISEGTPPFTKGTSEWRITEEETGRHITLVSTYETYPIRALFMVWMDDSMGREIDAMLNFMERNSTEPPANPVHA